MCFFTWELFIRQSLTRTSRTRKRLVMTTSGCLTKSGLGSPRVCLSPHCHLTFELMLQEQQPYSSKSNKANKSSTEAEKKASKTLNVVHGKSNVCGLAFQLELLGAQPCSSRSIGAAQSQAGSVNCNIEATEDLQELHRWTQSCPLWSLLYTEIHRDCASSMAAEGVAVEKVRTHHKQSDVQFSSWINPTALERGYWCLCYLPSIVTACCYTPLPFPNI